MPLCLINISDETVCVQSEITYEEETTSVALAKLLTFFVQNNVHYISVSATNEDAVITFCWDKSDWEQLCERAVNPQAELMLDSQMVEEQPSDIIPVPETSPKKLFVEDGSVEYSSTGADLLLSSQPLIKLKPHDKINLSSSSRYLFILDSPDHHLPNNPKLVSG